MNNKRKVNWQAKQYLADHLYGWGDDGVMSITIGAQVIPKQKPTSPIKPSAQSVNVSIQWDNQR